MVRRVAAAVFAVAVIAGALAIRNGWVGDDETRPKDKEVSNPYEVFEDDLVTLLCAVELVRLCDDMEGVVSSARVEPAWATVDRLAAGGALGADAWLTFRPLDQMAAPPAPAQSALGQPTLVGRSPIALAGPPAAMAAVEAACPNPRTLLSCAGTIDRVQLMLRDPTTSPAGALALAVVADELGAFASSTPSAEAPADLLARLVARSRGTPHPYEDVARLQVSAPSLALGFEGDVHLELQKLEFDARRAYQGVTVRYPFEARGVELVLAPSRSFGRAADLAKVFTSRPLAFSIERHTGFEVPNRRRDLHPTKAFTSRPTIRYDLPPPAPEQLRRLRALPGPGGGARVSP